MSNSPQLNYALRLMYLVKDLPGEKEIRDKIDPKALELGLDKWFLMV